MDDALHLDWETRSTSNLTKVGVHRYCEDPNTDAWCAGYKLNGQYGYWLPHREPVPDIIIDHVAAGRPVKAHNAAFERVVWNNVVRRDQPWLPEMTIEQMDCTMVRALAVNLPGDLANLAMILGLSQQKDMEGNALIKKMMLPRSIINGVITWWEDESMIVRGVQYCLQDVRTEEQVDLTLAPLQPGETELWHIDQRINERGFPVDRAMIERAAALVDHAVRLANAEMCELTGGMVRTCGQRDKIIAWLATRGIFTDTLRKSDHDDLLLQSDVYDDELARRVIELRRQAGKTSTAKYSTMLDCVCDDDHIRDTLQFCGAAQTGRWAGRLVQPQNYPRVADDEEAESVACVVNVLKDDDLSLEAAAELIELFGPPRLPSGEKAAGTALLPWLSKCLRSTIAAPRLTGGDFSNIEGRVNAWLAGEHWKLEAFRAFDAGIGPDLYKVAFSSSFGVRVDLVTRPQRQIGKVEELALGYQGGVGAFISMVNTYFIKLHELTRSVIEITDAKTWDTTARKFELARDRFNLSEEVWTACKIVVTKWRKANAAITTSWWELQDAAVNAVSSPGSLVSVYGGRCHYYSDGNYLMCYVPSGSYICYPQPFISNETIQQIYTGDQWVDVDTLDEALLDLLLEQGYEIVERKRVGVRFHHWENHTWLRTALYGGYQCENIVQKVARDILAYSMRMSEANGFPLRLTVHDELLSIPLDWLANAAGYKRLMSVQPPWADGLPVVATAWQDDRYVK